MRLFEAAAAAMEIDKGMENLFLGFEDGRLRRWSRSDEGNGARELARFDDVSQPSRDSRRAFDCL